MSKVGSMNYDCQEPRMGEGLVPLFTAAAIFWLIIGAAWLWLF